jgi:serine protease Do
VNRVETTLTALGLGLSVGFAVAISVGAWADPPLTPESTEAPTAVPPQTRSPSDSHRQTRVTRAVAEVAPSVVSITTEQPAADLFGRTYRRQSASSEGSGVVIDAKGIVLTNAHVVSSAARITVTFSDGRQGDARVLGLAEGLDLAVLQIAVPEGSALAAAHIGSSSDLILGEPVIAIGNPFGLGHTVTTGVVSATARALETDDRVFQDFIQTDASINPGNSGGPLLNADGDLIGINTAIRPDAQGIGFAIPIDRAAKVAKDLVESGMVRVPWLGVILADVSYSRQGIRTTGPEVVAAVVDVAGSEGLKARDIIVAIEGRAVQGRADLNAYLASLTPGDSLTLSVVRGQQTQTITVSSRVLGIDVVQDRTSGAVGWSFSPVMPGHQVGAKIDGITRTGSAGSIGLRPGDLILSIDGTRVQTDRDVLGAIQRAIARHRSTALITVRRGRAQGRVALPL